MQHFSQLSACKLLRVPILALRCPSCVHDGPAGMPARFAGGDTIHVSLPWLTVSNQTQVAHYAFKRTLSQKKTPARMPASVSICRKANSFFEEYAALPGVAGRVCVVKKVGVGRVLSINWALSPFLLPSCYKPAATSVKPTFRPFCVTANVSAAVQSFGRCAGITPS